MLSSLSSQNVIQYLHKTGLCSAEDGAAYKSVLPENSQKNRNLLVILADNRQLLIKQERKINNDLSSHELFNEWRSHQYYQLLEIAVITGEIATH